MKFYIFTFSLLASDLVGADPITIKFTADDSYTIEVAKIEVGNFLQWLPKNKGHNVDFLARPNIKTLWEKSDFDVGYRITFELPMVYLYQCTPYRNKGMLGFIVIGSNFYNLKKI